MSLLTSQERLDLRKLLHENDCEDNTENIRKVKHSGKIQADVHQFGYLRNMFFGSLPSDFTSVPKSKQTEFEEMVRVNCNFLFTTYPDIFRKMNLI